MRADADLLRDELEALNEVDGPVFKISNDPRCTPVGRFMRKFSLDELPQLVNIIKGECPLWGLAHPFRRKWKSTSAGSGAACACIPDSPVYGRSRGATNSASGAGWNWTLNTLTTGR